MLNIDSEDKLLLAAFVLHNLVDMCTCKLINEAISYNIMSRGDWGALRRANLYFIQFIYFSLKHAYMYTNNYKNAKEI